MQDNRKWRDGNWETKTVNGVKYVRYVKRIGASDKKRVEVYGNCIIL